MYRALYRKYRPMDFSDVYGQPHIVRTLKNQIAEGKLSHAYLFTGSRGTGKTTCAKILAKTVNCLQPKDGIPCNQCEMCKAAAADSLIDITEIDAASNNGVDDIRELRDNTAYTPAVAKYRVFIIDEVHMLSTPAFNALLKTLEEPPEYVIFILATTEVHKLPATILSRCQRFDFRRIQPDDIAARLKEVSSLEGIDLTEDGAAMLAKLADGAMRDALSLLDTCAADGTTIDEKKVLDVAGLSGRQYLYDLTTAIAEQDAKEALLLIDQLYKKAKDLSRLCDEMVSYLRDMMMLKTVDHPENFLVLSQQELAGLKEVANILPLEKIIHAMDTLEETKVRIAKGADRRTAMERTMMVLCEPQLDTTVSALLSRLESLEHRAPAAAVVPTPAPVAEEPVEIQEEVVEETPAVTPPPEEKPTGDVELEEWNDILVHLGKTDMMLKAVLKNSKAYVKDDIVLIDVVNQSFRDMINGESRHRNALKSAIAAVTGKQYRIGPYNRPQTQQKTEDDPLDALIENALQNGLM